MKSIPKENIFIYTINDIYYCLDKTKNSIEGLGNGWYGRDNIFLEDVTIDSKGRIHSFNDKPAIVCRNNFYGKISKVSYWLKDGKWGRENEEKPYYVQVSKEDSKYFILNGKTTIVVSSEYIRKNLNENNS
jgi:hypothetical protein